MPKRRRRFVESRNNAGHDASSKENGISKEDETSKDDASKVDDAPKGNEAPKDDASKGQRCFDDVVQTLEGYAKTTRIASEGGHNK